MATQQTTAVERYRRPKGQHPRRRRDIDEKTVEQLPEYLEAHEIDALIRAAPNPRARLLFLIEWRAGLRISEALDLEVSDLSLNAENPTLRVRSGKGRRSRVVPVHPELATAFRLALSYGTVSDGRLVDVHRSSAWRRVQSAVRRAEELALFRPAGAWGPIRCVTASRATCWCMGSRSTTCRAGWVTALSRRR